MYAVHFFIADKDQSICLLQKMQLRKMAWKSLKNIKFFQSRQKMRAILQGFADRSEWCKNNKGFGLKLFARDL